MRPVRTSSAVTALMVSDTYITPSATNGVASAMNCVFCSWCSQTGRSAATLVRLTCASREKRCPL
ncbi:MAG: hypothetical protein IPK33_20030 [Gemmatimonadetes bacterium]|nr:hypothetical protein [Gemmatimonadota bacterium]